MNPKPEPPAVLVTGANGFIALHCILKLLERGYRVRGALRSLTHEAGLRAALARHIDLADRLTFVQADLLQDAGWAEAVQGCDFILHTASPLPLSFPKNENELIVPARDGTLRVLRAAVAAGVKRVVLTSSLAAVAEGHAGREKPFDEEDWSILENISPYAKSKTIAERAAWDFVRSPANTNGLELAAINPSNVFGPLLDSHKFASSEPIRLLMSRGIPAVPRILVSLVDVRDVAAAHIAAMLLPAAAGQRFCCTAATFWMQDMALILARHFAPLGYRIPTAIAPDVLVRLMALFDETARFTLPYLGKQYRISTGRIQSVLGWEPRSAQDAILSMAQSLIDFEIIQKKTHA